MRNLWYQTVILSHLLSVSILRKRRKMTSGYFHSDFSHVNSGYKPQLGWNEATSLILEEFYVYPFSRNKCNDYIQRSKSALILSRKEKLELQTEEDKTGDKIGSDEDMRMLSIPQRRTEQYAENTYTYNNNFVVDISGDDNTTCDKQISRPSRPSVICRNEAAKNLQTQRSTVIVRPPQRKADSGYGNNSGDICKQSPKVCLKCSLSINHAPSNCIHNLGFASISSFPPRNPCATDQERKKRQGFRCEQCQRTFKQKYNLTKHVKTIHEKVMTFHCSQCNKRFVREKDFSRHVDNMHRRIRVRYNCSHCDRLYLRKPLLTRHMKHVHNIIE